MFQRISQVAVVWCFFLFLSSTYAKERLHPEGIKDHFIGNIDAKSTLIVYTSPTCGHCIHFEEQIFPALKQRYIENGHLKVAIRPMVLNYIDAVIYLVSLSNGAENRSEILARYRQSYDEMISAKDLESTLRKIAATVGISEKQFNQALNNTEYLQKLEKLNQQAIDEFGVIGAPTFFLNGEKIAYDGSLDSLSKKLEHVLNKKQ